MDFSRLYKYNPDEDNESQQIELPEENDMPQIEEKKSIHFKILLYIVVIALLFIVYVANVIKVKSLLKEENKLEKKLEFIENNNQILNTEINRLESPERITNIAIKKFGMIKPDVPPKVISKK